MSAADATSRDIWIVYDGECPFCRSYVLFYRLRDQGRRVHLVDARAPDPVAEEIRRRKLDLNRGMVVKIDDRLYFGTEAINLLGILGSTASLFNRINHVLFGHPRCARLLYPILVRGRLLTLRLLGRPLIDGF
jgi:predicted DCC family thiol-disulfide oxidoreductase YuxK